MECKVRHHAALACEVARAVRAEERLDVGVQVRVREKIEGSRKRQVAQVAREEGPTMATSIDSASTDITQALAAELDCERQGEELLS